MAKTPASAETASTTPPTLDKSLEAIRERLGRVLDELRARYRVRSLALFGSRVRGGETGPGSDLDLLVSFEVLPDLITFTALQKELEDVVGMRVDLVLHDSLKPRLRPQILREAVEVPNALTEETLRKSERGEDVDEAKDADDLFRQLGI